MREQRNLAYKYPTHKSDDDVSFCRLLSGNHLAVRHVDDLEKAFNIRQFNMN